MMNHTMARSPMAITFSVWKAIFLREALERLFDMRAAWLWLVMEPLMHMGFYAFIYSVLRMRSVGGADVVIWIVVGMLGFFLFRRTADQVTHAVDSNQPLFAYRQVKPFDAAFMRAVLECFLMLIVSIIILAIAALLGYFAPPTDILLILVAFAGLWLFGLGYGLIASVAMRMIPEMKHILKILMLPLYIISGVIWPLHMIPQPYQGWLMINPIAHGVELVRDGFVYNYHVIPGTNLGYLYVWGSVSLFLGLLLYRRFDAQLVMK
ncbi:capsular polysaccharide transport system permease protein [Nitrosomonas eutropha]|uniref:ABC transporter permease n=1 Tax=Nitrosomonas eutropha TaxID=916 RepID=UPI00088776A9|nr:ABC transporter permease [Nitrosomonas eutropha]SCX11351.1 capsular polysaccharide transport system permease protein [Nitrosomonas eutropha]